MQLGRQTEEITSQHELPSLPQKSSNVDDRAPSVLLPVIPPELVKRIVKGLKERMWIWWIYKVII